MIKNLNLEKIITYWTLILCLSSMAIATISVGIIEYFESVDIIFFLIASSFILLSIILYKKNISKKQILKFLIFSLITVFIGLILNNIPNLIELGEIEASISIELISSICLLFVGWIGSFLTLLPLYNFSKKANQSSGFMVLILCIIFVIYPLILILISVFINGSGALNFNFLVNDLKWSKLGTDEFGVAPAIGGTLWLMLLTFTVSVPLGIGAAIYLHEYAKQGLIVRIIITSVNILRGTPSIVFGLFAFAVFVPIFGTSLLSAGLVLGFYALPMVIRSSEEALKSIPDSLREGSYALGGTKWQTIKRVVLPPASPGIITGTVLGVGEASGEAAPIIFLATAFGAGFPTSIFDRFAALPTQIYYMIGFSYKEGVIEQLWGMALILITIVLIINFIAIIVREKFRTEF